MHHKLYRQQRCSRNTDDEVIGLSLSDRAIFTEALNIFKNGRSLLCLYSDAERTPSPVFEGLNDGSFPLPEEMKKTLLGDYLMAMNYFDRELGRFLEGLSASGPG